MRFCAISVLWGSLMAYSFIHAASFVPLQSKRIGQTALFAKKINKQMELAKKMRMAREQREQKEDPEAKKLSDEEVKERNDRLRFEQLLNYSESSSFMDEYSGGQYHQTQTQMRDDYEAQRKGVDRIFEGDPAPTSCFDHLVDIQTNDAIGEAGTSKLLPWLRKNNNQDDFLIIISEPRVKSPALRQVLDSIMRESTKGSAESFWKRIIVINPDTPAENRRYVRKKKIEGIKIFSDDKREWMRAYTALEGERWGICVFVVKDGRVDKLIRDLFPVFATQVIRTAVEAL